MPFEVDIQQKGARQQQSRNRRHGFDRLRTYRDGTEPSVQHIPYFHFRAPVRKV
ncbi:hypothetical protein [Neisseria meningitidis]|uniref:hypothetical protein n=1 Tax=Neisseria meningitidis TaxID=487 RepID=UPI001F0C1BEB|nr:hypothetical protein [Neisseria meningitidis]